MSFGSGFGHGGNGHGIDNTQPTATLERAVRWWRGVAAVCTPYVLGHTWQQALFTGTMEAGRADKSTEAMHGTNRRE